MNNNNSEQHYRKLTKEETGQLIMQGCSCDDWNLVEVKENFNPENVKNSRFSGSIRLGCFEEEVSLFGGISFKSGIYNAWLHNCIVEDQAMIYNVRSYIANYHIGRRVIIHNITTLAVDGVTSFGNGTRIETVNEGGGREVPIYDDLSAHVAYIIALYRHREKLIAGLEKLIGDYVKYVSNDMGFIGPGSQIINCDTIKNVKTGPAAHIEGARKLSNGSINSSFDDPVIIGDGVIMENFIVCSGSHVNDATLISNCFIGQGCNLDKHYSAVQSLFFANCQGLHGEACSIFAGPYTVTHHKSTLLIAGMFSFLNAGSGSNQSNHLYKLGPIHQGIVERGAKTTSDSYILWPSHIGAFSLVMGRHYKHPDTSDFPFSYLIENKDESILVPGVNLKSIGTIRDSQKWPKRDIRKDPNLLDYINFNLLSPYTIQKMLNGKKILLSLLHASGSQAEEYSWQGMKIRRNSLEKGIRLYDMAIWKFIGNSIITRIKLNRINNPNDLTKAFKSVTTIGSGRWIDLSGMLCPASALNKLLSDIENGAVSSLEEINSILKSMHLNYYNYEWTWTKNLIGSLTGKQTEELSPLDIIQIIERWKEYVLTIDRLLYEDARKEFSLLKKTGFGIDGGEEIRERDFENVRGDFESNEAVKTIHRHAEEKKQLGDAVIEQMHKIMEKQTISN